MGEAAVKCWSRFFFFFGGGGRGGCFKPKGFS